MSVQDYLPRQDSLLVAWLGQFKTELTTSATALGIPAADLTALGTNVTSVQTLVQDQVSKKAAHQAATAAKKTALKSVLPQLRALVKRVKSSTAYTPSIGERLGIVGAELTPLMADVAGGTKPRLTAGEVRNGSVQIAFKKNGFTGIQLSCRRGSETQPVSLEKQLYSPYVDDRKNLAPGPETRYYQAWYLDGDEIVGEASDILVVTVPE